SQNVNAADPTGSRTMGYYDQTDLPFYFGLYNTFATGDRYFSSVQTQTWPNRLYLLAGSSFGYIRNDSTTLSFPSVFNILDQAGITWRIYSSFYPSSYARIFFAYVDTHATGRIFPISQYAADLAAGTLPQVSFVDPDLSAQPKTEND